MILALRPRPSPPTVLLVCGRSGMFSLSPPRSRVPGEARARVSWRRGRAGLGLQQDSERGLPGAPLCSQAPSEQLVSPACQGGSQRPCSGNGHCSGDGTREGDGSCQCHLGYRGPLCADCADGYFRSPGSEARSICSGTGSACRPRAGPMAGGGARRARRQVGAGGGAGPASGP